MSDDQAEGEAGLAAANRFFDGLLAGDLAALQAACASGSILWINLTEQERALEDSLPRFAALRSKVPDLRMESVRDVGSPAGSSSSTSSWARCPDGEPLRVVGCFIGTVENDRISRLEEYVDGRQAGALSALAEEQLTPRSASSRRRRRASGR